jgi:hypothetical protein
LEKHIFTSVSSDHFQTIGESHNNDVFQCTAQVTSAKFIY